MAGKSDTSNRGFASMDEDKQREIARKGGESVPDEKRSFSKDHEWLPRPAEREAKACPTRSAASRRIANSLRRRDARVANGKAAAGRGKIPPGRIRCSSTAFNLALHSTS
jgi:hypothetical protein